MRFGQSTTVAKATGVLLSLLLSSPAVSGAQALNAGKAQVKQGDRIRVTSRQTGEKPVVALFRGMAGDSLFVFRNPGGPFALALSDVEQLDVSRISRTRGALYGAGIGIVPGTLLWMPVWCQEGHNTGEISTGECLIRSLTFGIPTGVLLGAVLGGLMGSETWRPISLPGTLRIGAGPRSAALHLRVALP